MAGSPAASGRRGSLKWPLQTTSASKTQVVWAPEALLSGLARAIVTCHRCSDGAMSQLPTPLLPVFTPSVLRPVLLLGCAGSSGAGACDAATGTARTTRV